MQHRFHSLVREVGLAVPNELGNPLITNISCDSRCAVSGSLFLGMPGVKVDGGIFWRDALAAGAVAAVIGPQAAKENPPGSQNLVMVVPDPVAKWIGEMASAFWGKPSSKITLIGVTGTNGKTTTSHLIEHLGASLGKPTALFGTLVNRWPRHSVPATHTTGFADVLQAQLAEAVNSGAQFGAMEVSSHALHQQRVAGCRFGGAVFTNLTQDHLDYHSSMEEYFEAKANLFLPPLLEMRTNSAVVNVDNSWGLHLAERLGDCCWRSSLVENAIENDLAELTITDFQLTDVGARGKLISPCGEGTFRSPLLGHFNLMNILQAVGVLLQKGLPLTKLLTALEDFRGVPGRMELVKLVDIENFALPMVLVDYAHTPDSLANALLSLRPFTRGELICVFGCGGDRDRGKRPQMGAIAAELADRLVLTSDNPRTESPEKILDDVICGIPPGVALKVEKDRAIAIALAIAEANPEDLVLVAGKGHEDYQIIGSRTVHFDDREEAKKALRERLS